MAIPMSQFNRPSHRNPGQLREIKITRHYTKHAEGSVLVEFGDTKVLCTASVEASVPRFLKGTGRGWVTAEYGMLPDLLVAGWTARPLGVNSRAERRRSSA